MGRYNFLIVMFNKDMVHLDGPTETFNYGDTVIAVNGLMINPMEKG